MALKRVNLCLDVVQHMCTIPYCVVYGSLRVAFCEYPFFYHFYYSINIIGNALGVGAFHFLLFS